VIPWFNRTIQLKMADRAGTEIPVSRSPDAAIERTSESLNWPDSGRALPKDERGPQLATKLQVFRVLPRGTHCFGKDEEVSAMREVERFRSP
jgi:hypothetical protein